MWTPPPKRTGSCVGNPIQIFGQPPPLKTGGLCYLETLEFIDRMTYKDSFSYVVSKALEMCAAYRNIPLSLKDELLITLSREREGASTPVLQILDTVMKTDHLPKEEQLRIIATSYVEKTRFLFPLIDSFAKTVKSVLELGKERYLPVLLLRDGLSFWPALQAHGVRPFLVSYSRLHGEHRAIGDFLSAPLADIPPRNTLLIDVGLYGSLVASLIAEGAFPKVKPGALFFASRSPFIWGWANTLLSSSFSFSSSRCDFGDTIRLADTLESLLKPFTYFATNSGIISNISDPISFVCSIAFLRELSQFSREQNSSTPEELVRGIALAKADRNTWLVREPVKRWDKADEFIKSWAHGPLFPMDRMSGFGL